MAANLRLGQDRERALRAESARTGRSRQELIREAVDQYLGLAEAPVTSELADLVRAGARLPRSPYRRVTAWMVPPEGGATTLLDREDRF